MRNIDYQARFEWISQRRRRFWPMIDRIVYVVLIGIPVSVCCFVMILAFKYKLFDARTQDARLIGKTAQQVIRLLGPPGYDSVGEPPGRFRPVGARELNYFGMPGQGCTIYVFNGKVVGVEHDVNGSPIPPNSPDYKW